MGLAPAEAVLPGLDGCESGWVVLAQQGAELVGDLLAVPGCVLLSAGEDGSDAVITPDTARSSQLTGHSRWSLAAGFVRFE